MASITEIQALLEENQKKLLAGVQQNNTLVENSILTLTERLASVEQNFESKIRDIDENLKHKPTPNAPKKYKKKSKTRVKKEQTLSTFFKSDSEGDSDNSVKSHFSHVSNLSILSNEEDIALIKQLSNPRFKSKDAKIKLRLDELKTIQEKYLKRIPKLAYTSNDSGTPTHNYGVWITALLKYYFVLSPALASAVKNFLSTVDVDSLLIDGPNLAIPTSKTPTMMRTMAMVLDYMSGMPRLVLSPILYPTTL